mmetsp:Transcript_29482/g.40505  ORF Transcript_29482/g.40505 Transcript_29482/m.40505 type:complete len:86 (-) Transcript_29482:326-583(-)
MDQRLWKGAAVGVCRESRRKRLKKQLLPTDQQLELGSDAEEFLINNTTPNPPISLYIYADFCSLNENVFSALCLADFDVFIRVLL